jgi:hypothetical protein
MVDDLIDDEIEESEVAEKKIILTAFLFVLQ